MSETTIRFDDGEAYERGMGVWSRRVGEIFLDWLAPVPGLAWIDVGCGNGAFTELLVQRCSPREVQGVDPSDAQLRFARERPGAEGAVFREGDAMALPFEAGRFDAAVMALVIFFVPEPAKGLAEMIRIVRPGGMISAYAWDMLGGGFPFDAIQAELRTLSRRFFPRASVSPACRLCMSCGCRPASRRSRFARSR
jgi:ubiquinone/menaquinone biosynthesis C-methylase UbiE